MGIPPFKSIGWVLQTLARYGIRKCPTAPNRVEPNDAAAPRPLWKGAGGNGASPGANAT